MLWYAHSWTMIDLEQLQRCIFFFFNDTATTEIYTLSLHDALPISGERRGGRVADARRRRRARPRALGRPRPRAEREGPAGRRSEEHTSELQSRQYLVCRLLLEKKTKHHKSIQPFITNTTRPILYTS